MDIEQLFYNLHKSPELAWTEKHTSEILKEYLINNTDLTIVDKGKFFYGIHDEKADRTIGVRTDIDSICDSENIPFHGCGHDGHMSMVCYAASLLKGKKIGKNVVFLFQPAEENGSGAKVCLSMFDDIKVDKILGLHNIPGFPLGQVLIRMGTFADASLGLTIFYKGVQSHAAYPSFGVNPAFTIANLISKLSEIEKREIFKSFVQITVIYIHVGEKNFGINAGYGEIGLTLRAEKTKELSLLKNIVLKEVQNSIDETYSKEDAEKIKISYEVKDEFPATENKDSDSKYYYEALKNENIDVTYLDSPMRWSEDFGLYVKKANSFFFGLGSGKDHAPLHTRAYSFPKELIKKSGKIWFKMINLS